MKTSIFIITLLISFTTIGQSLSKTKAIKHYNIDSDNVAIDGYDLVTYFENSEPKKGKKQFQENYNGISYQFSSNENRMKFKTNPTKYLPQYGAWCAYAMGDNGDKVSVNPETYKIVDGKLYLFYNKLFVNTLKSWNKDEDRIKAKADANWTTVLTK